MTAVVLALSMVLLFVPMVAASFASKLIVNRDAFTHEEQEEMKAALAELLRRLPEQEARRVLNGREREARDTR